MSAHSPQAQENSMKTTPQKDTQSAAEKAVFHLLRLIQEDPDRRYYMGEGTASFELLCAAEAEITGKPVERVMLLRGLDLQPEYRFRLPDILLLKKKIEIYERAREESAYVNPDDLTEKVQRELDAWEGREIEKRKAAAIAARNKARELLKQERAR